MTHEIGDEYAGRLAAVEQSDRSAHKRLDSINGQILRLAKANEALVEKLNDERKESDAIHSSMRDELIALRTRLTTMTAILGVVGTAMVGAVATSIVTVVNTHSKPPTVIVQK